MCNFKSALCLKDRVFVPDYDSHDQMLAELKIPDDFAHASKVFVRVELSPADGDPTSDPMGWRIRIGQDILPDWFVHEIDEQRVKVAIADWCKVHVLREGTHEVHEGKWIATGSSNVVALDSSNVEAWDSSNVEAWDSSKVEAWDSSNVVAWDSSKVEAWDSSNVVARGSSNVEAWDSSKVVARGSSKVVARGSSTIILPKNWQTVNPVQMHDEAICINHKTHKVKSAIKWTQED